MKNLAGELGFEPRIATSKGWSPTVRRLPKIYQHEYFIKYA